MNIAELKNQRTELQNRLDAVMRDFRKGLDADSSERAVELENADVLNEIARVCREQIADIDRQLAAIAAPKT